MCTVASEFQSWLGPGVGAGGKGQAEHGATGLDIASANTRHPSPEIVENIPVSLRIAGQSTRGMAFAKPISSDSHSLVSSGACASGHRHNGRRPNGQGTIGPILTLDSTDRVKVLNFSPSGLQDPPTAWQTSTRAMANVTDARSKSKERAG